MECAQAQVEEGTDGGGQAWGLLSRISNSTVYQPYCQVSPAISDIKEILAGAVACHNVYVLMF